MADLSKRIDNVAGAGIAVKWIQENIIKGLAGGPVIVTLGREARSVDQNKLLWALLTDISAQVTWFDRNHSPEDWKEIISASFNNCELVPNCEKTGFVAIGVSTSKMNKARFSELVEYIYAFGADQSVSWSDPSLEVFAQYRESKS